MMSLRVVHLVVGVAGLIAFAASGMYMVWVHAGLQGMPDEAFSGTSNRSVRS